MKQLFELRLYAKLEKISTITFYATRRQADKIFFSMAFGLAYSNISSCDFGRISLDGVFVPLNSFRVFGGLEHVPTVKTQN